MTEFAGRRVGLSERDVLRDMRCIEWEFYVIDRGLQHRRKRKHWTSGKYIYMQVLIRACLVGMVVYIQSLADGVFVCSNECANVTTVHACARGASVAAGD